MKKKLLDRKWWIITVVAVVGIAWFFISRKPKIEYDEYQVKSAPIQETLELSGEVAAGTSAVLRFPAGGLVTYVGAKEGDQVAKWQTIAKLDTRLLQKSMEEKLNLYAIQRNTFDQTVDDNDNSVPTGDLQRTLERLLRKNQYQLENTVKDVEYQNLSIKLSSIYTPVAGILVHAPIQTAGVNVLPTDTWNIVDPTSLYFSADLDETDLKRVSVGQKTTVKLDAFPDMAVDTRVADIAYSPAETSTGTTYPVKISLFPEDMAKLRLGLNGTASVVLSEKNDTLVLPASAIGTKNGSSFVYVKNGEKYVEVPVKTGIENMGLVEIVSGVQNGETVYQVK